ncbi:MAG: LptF/LptG family permease [Planctomycetia bacterium]
MYPTLIHRMIFLDLTKTFLLALAGTSTLLMLIGAMVEATRQGLDPVVILTALPYLIPPMLPYTIPTCLLVACTVVYGGMSSNNEIIALKAGGIHLFHAILPALVLGVVMSGVGVYLTDQFIPACNARFAKIMLSDMQSTIYAYLKNKGALVQNDFPFEIYVQNVRGDKLIRPIFKRRGPKGDYDMVAQADEAVLEVTQDPSGEKDPVCIVRLKEAIATNESGNGGQLRDRPLELPLPKMGGDGKDSKLQHLTFKACFERAERHRRQAAEWEAEMSMMAVAASIGTDPNLFARALNKPPTSGSPTLVGADPFPIAKKLIHSPAVIQIERRRALQAEADVHVRIAQSVAALPFILLGCPISILFQRRDFLQSFFVCFLPIITIYYPATILAVNVYKEGNGWLATTVWLPTILAVAAALPLLRKVLFR